MKKELQELAKELLEAKEAHNDWKYTDHNLYVLIENLCNLILKEKS